MERSGTVALKVGSSYADYRGRFRVEGPGVWVETENLRVLANTVKGHPIGGRWTYIPLDAILTITDVNELD